MPTFADLLAEANREVKRFLAELGFHNHPELQAGVIHLRSLDDHRPVPLRLDTPFCWPDQHYAWFTIPGVGGGTDAYFNRVDQLCRDRWAWEFDHTTRVKPHKELLQRALDQGYYWSFRRSMGQPALIAIGYGPAASRLGGGGGVAPARIQTRRTEETLDTPENRFVKFTLTRWRDTVAQIGAVLAAELFREVGEMAHFPTGSQVLQKKAGYRDLFQAFVQFDAAARLTWSGGEAVYRAGQRNVAALYEYWVFLQLASIVSKLCSLPFDQTRLLEESDDRLDLGLRQGVERVLSGSIDHLGRRLHLELWFNRTFSRGEGRFSSWTRPMRPDCSLRIYPDRETPAFEEVWVHFDAKYRVENLQAIIGDELITGADEQEAQAVTNTSVSAARRDDLLKMHAYRDAIRRSAGAYVIYPGSDLAPSPWSPPRTAKRKAPTPCGPLSSMCWTTSPPRSPSTSGAATGMSRPMPTSSAPARPSPPPPSSASPLRTRSSCWAM